MTLAARSRHVIRSFGNSSPKNSYTTRKSAFKAIGIDITATCSRTRNASLTHPSNLITDYLLAIICIVLAVHLGRSAMARQSSALKLWAISYLITAVAAMTGGTYHGLFGMLGDVGATILWKVTVYAIGLTSLTMLAASVTTVVAPGRRICWIVPIVAKFV